MKCLEMKSIYTLEICWGVAANVKATLKACYVFMACIVSSLKSALAVFLGFDQRGKSDVGEF